MPREDLEVGKKQFNRFIDMIVAVATVEVNKSPESAEAVEMKEFEARVEDALDKESVSCDKCNTTMILRAASRMGAKRKMTTIMGVLTCPSCGHTLPYKRMVR